MSMSVLNVLRSVAQLSKGFWWGPHAARAWMLTIGAFSLALLDVGVQVALNHWTKEFFDATVENCRKVIDAVKPKRTKFTIEMMPWSLPDGPDGPG